MVTRQPLSVEFSLECSMTIVSDLRTGFLGQVRNGLRIAIPLNTVCIGPHFRFLRFAIPNSRFYYRLVNYVLYQFSVPLGIISIGIAASAFLFLFCNTNPCDLEIINTIMPKR